ncbi:hypothetical protein JQ554_30470 [Bradyrhizobium diazoefficiens]|nr:hypothetical protein [Bradyrhizobium diazoefficiens]MBR0968499.1 hypothetical protein [Bradyrhizobium diazoefficiens]MBR0981823.1 hypothetical protein [Bradyrhizobium diazoefficiens]MBR1011274.1 hypothetical protein [Bradyrhizobium diazoefficiens]MBR1015741.1 hypothetical protein [Bradyrhizobium diazoefficiens]MBR1055114.1 hypothetical protein [Bradyrhizobium diazoefficiens]
MADFAKDAEQVVRERKKGRAKNPTARNVGPFLDGTLVPVDFKDEDGDDDADFVFFHGGTHRYIEIPDDVIDLVKDHVKVSFLQRIGYSLLDIGGISGLIALLIVLAMVAMTLTRIPIDDNWWKVFTLVMGFYFGNVTAKSR